MKKKLQNIYVAVVAAVVLCLSGMVAPGGARDATSRPPAVVADGGQLCDASLWVRETGEAELGGGIANTLTMAQRTVRTANDNKPSQDDSPPLLSGCVATSKKFCPNSLIGSTEMRGWGMLTVDYYILVRHIIR